jgi:hypothetical protein
MMMKSFYLALVLTLLGSNSLFAEPPKLDWVRVTDKANWQPRDSSVELVYKNRLWIMGGWFNSYASPPRDVWSTADGKSWNMVTKKAAWKHSDFSMAAVFKDQMFFMGGWYNGRLPDHSASNQVWASKDGANWKQVTKNAGWSPRIASGLVVFKDKLWMLGGTEDYYFGNEKNLKNDVWSSVDGKTWKRETANAGWSPRAYLQAVVFNGKIYVIAGGNYVPKYEALNDVWSSEDGIHWVQETKAAPWHPRIWFSSVVYRDHIWVLGGWSNSPNRNWNDVWYSKNGKDWTQLKSDVVWKERHEQSTFVFQDKIWITGGHAKPLNAEVWTLDVPKDWFKKRR